MSPAVADVEASVVAIDSGGVPLHGVLYAPTAPVGGLVFCHPFAEEKKCAHRALVDLARGCAEAGWAALSFDMRGCGDSPGAFGDQDPDAWRQDIRAALDFLAAAIERPVGLLGLRLGATLAAQVAGEREGLACLVMLEPVVIGERYVRDNLRRSIIKAMLTKREGGESFDAAQVTAAAGAGSVDFDGYPVSAAMQEQLKALDLLASPPSYAGPTLVVNLGAGGEVPQELRELADACPRGDAIAVHQEPIWQRIGLMDASPMVQATVDWLQHI